ncbi:AAA family ATPase [Alkaliphilus transvaalensis]|uniref:AAA family ATPase n=1 Tax=Alkaliphilus transvaalensis TaxID=114628 RepID=UPI00047A6F79|nr:AAA family ATPase [Alkaliphilus transvaalensis]
MNKKLIVVNGTMAVGKTTTCRLLNSKLQNSVWLDGDWCWRMNPFVVNDENKRMVENNISYLLRNFFSNSSIEYIIFNWVIHTEAIMEMVLDWVKNFNFDLYKITLTCSEDELKERLLKRQAHEEMIKRSIERLALYEDLDTFKIDTTNKRSEEVAEEIIKLIKRKFS